MYLVRYRQSQDLLLETPVAGALLTQATQNGRTVSFDTRLTTGANGWTPPKLPAF